MISERVPGDVVVVGMAQTCRLHLDQHLASMWGVDLDRLDAPRSLPRPEDRSLCLHPILLSLVVAPHSAPRAARAAREPRFLARRDPRASYRRSRSLPAWAKVQRTPYSAGL